MDTKQHWEQVYRHSDPDALSWSQPGADFSLRLIRETGLPGTASIIDIGGGASRLVDDLLSHGYSTLSVLDLSAAALASARQRLGPMAHTVDWIVGDITTITLPFQAHDLWHDRAVFHFLSTAGLRQAYVAAMLRAVKPGGQVIVATFADDGPTQCSGLPVMRYTPERLQAAFGAPFTLLRHTRETHRTPSGTQQQFIYCHFRREAA